MRGFQNRLATVRAESSRRRAENQSLAAKAGVPHQYQNEVYVSRQSDGSVNVYFGGVGEPNGPGHGHYVLDRSGKVIYRRDPFDPHGAQNFEDNRREAATLSMARLAMSQWANYAHKTPRRVQHEDAEFKVEAGSGYSRKYRMITTDVLIYDKRNKKEHYHIVIDENGREIFSEWRPNRRK